MRRATLLILILVSAALLPPSSRAATSELVPIELGTMIPDDLPVARDAESGALDINGSDVVVGYAATTRGQMHAFRWQQGVFEELLPLPGANESGATAINDAGLIVGQSTFPDGSRRATLWRNGEVLDLGTLGGSSSMAWDLNITGDVVGWAETAGGKRHATLWRNGGAIDLGTLGGDGSEAYGISQAGDVVGMAQPASGAPRPFLWQDGALSELPSGDGALGGYATDINADGIITGVVAYSGGVQSAALWMGESLYTVLDLIKPGLNPGAVLMTESTSISDTGVITGSAGDAGAALFQNATVTLLPPLDRFHSGGVAHGISLRGWVVGLTFVSTPEGPVPRATIWVPARDAEMLQAIATPAS